VNLPRLALRNTFRRNFTRAALTFGGVAVLTLAFVFLRTIISAFTLGSDEAKVDRLITRNRISLTFTLPLAYLDKIKGVPGITQASYSNWFGGVYKDQRNFFAKFAIDPDDYFKVYPEMTVEPADLAAFRADRTGCLIGEDLAKKYDFKKGDVIKVKGDIYPGDWAYTVDGIIHSKNNFERGSMYFQWKYLDSGVSEARRGMVGTFEFLVADPDHSADVSKAVDALFQSSAYETHTESEQAFILGFVNSSQAIVAALQAVSFALLFIMLLIMGNTLAMSLRERTGELAVMRTLGFRPRHLVELLLSEGFWLALAGGLLGLLFSYFVISKFIDILGGFLSPDAVHKLLWRWSIPSVGLAIAIGLLASVIPAIRAARINVIAALRRVE
jgi:putative ABC transport system permease protein